MMPRRCTEAVPLLIPPKKKSKTVNEVSALDISYLEDGDDETPILPSGHVLKDIQQRNWRIGKPIGKGSFGRIYLASDDVDSEVTKQNARYVVKIEPHTNGPLFVEIHCLIRCAKVSKVKEWRHNKQKRLGMPIYIASGSYVEAGVKYRFLVLPRYHVDLQKVISKTKVLDLKNVLVLALQILDVLEYLHSHGYTHSDIKSSNLVLGFDGMKHCKMPAPKLTQSFQKDTKELSVLTGKQRRAKNGKSRNSNYYDDEDFIVKDYKSPTQLIESNENDKRLANVKKKLRKILLDKDNRTLHRNHAFNLRQLSNYVNYEDMNSSVCSDNSYQRLLDDFGNTLIRSEEFNDINNKKSKALTETDTYLNDIYQEAILSQSNGQIYLLDYGLASKFIESDGKHKEFCMDARKAHDGTLEYSSRDSHIGAHSRRSDLETLGYNILDWLTNTLPWKTTEILSQHELVHALKKNFMSDVKLLLKTCFKTEFYPVFLEKYLQYVASLDFTEKPDYNYCRSLFKSELQKNGNTTEKHVGLNLPESPKSPRNFNKLNYVKRFGKKNTSHDLISRNSYERENVYCLQNDLKLELLKETLNLSREGVRKPCTSRNFFLSDADLVARLKKSLMPHDILGKKLSPKNLRSKKKTIQKRKGVRKHRSSIGKFGNFLGSAKQFTWAEILAGNPEDIIRKERNTNTSDENDDETKCKYRIRKLSNASSDSNVDQLQSPLMQKDYLQALNPTYAMKEVVANFKKKVLGKSSKEVEDIVPELEGYTPAMIKVYKMKQKREAKEKLEALKQQNLSKKEIEPIQPRRTRSNKTVSINLKLDKQQKADKQTTITPRCTRSVKKVSDKSDSKPTVQKSAKKAVCSANTKEKGEKKTVSDIKEMTKECKVVIIKVDKLVEEVKSPVKTKNRSKTTGPVFNRIRLRSSRRKTSPRK